MMIGYATVCQSLNITFVYLRVCQGLLTIVKIVALLPLILTSFAMMFGCAQVYQSSLSLLLVCLTVCLSVLIVYPAMGMTTVRIIVPIALILRWQKARLQYQRWQRTLHQSLR